MQNFIQAMYIHSHQLLYSDQENHLAIYSYSVYLSENDCFPMDKACEFSDSLICDQNSFFVFINLNNLWFKPPRQEYSHSASVGSLLLKYLQ